MARHPHLILPESGTIERYTSIRSGRRDFDVPDRDPAQHAARLLRNIAEAQTQRGQFPRRVGNGFYQSPGLTLAFESEPQFPLAFEGLDLSASKIQLLSVITDAENRTIATVHVPDDKIHILINKLERYARFDPDIEDKPKNQKLVASISNIKLATLRELWTDDTTLYPGTNESIIWEVWLRRGVSGEDQSLSRFNRGASDFGYQVLSTPLTFVDRTVVLVRSTREQLALGSDVLGIIAEVRRAKITADLFAGLPPSEQQLLADDLLQRIAIPNADVAVIGLLDTGVNEGHPLLAPIMSQGDVHTLKPAWGTHDSYPNGHGTQMAGLALYGDFTPLLANQNTITLTHRLQSLKLIHVQDPHEPELYGSATIEGVSRLEIDASRQRVYCLAITADGRDRGRPSSWSAAIDNLAFGAIDDTRRLILVSAGNTEFDRRSNYPTYNEISSVQDPAQAWNAVTVGGYTEKVFIDSEANPGWTILAEHGDLAPCSTTSVTWPPGQKCAVKPDIVMEAGNMAVPPGGGGPDFLDELQILTTNSQFAAGHRPFTTFRDTSAATALAARLAAQLLSRYPQFEPETIRGLLVHSSNWTPAMLARAVDRHGNLDIDKLLRFFGYGTPDTERLFYSADNCLTLILQETLQPFFKDTDGAIKTRDIKIHSLPWPSDALRELPLSTQVEMRVTLSYFIEPSPGERGWDRKYGYASHGLRVSVIRALETPDEFKLRINAYDRDDDYEEDHVGETGEWTLGIKGPTKGSIHSNIWRGTAADLARRNYIAVHPTLGWWRTRSKEQRFDRQVHYTLIVSILTPEQSVDIYTPVAAQIGIEVPINW